MSRALVNRRGGHRAAGLWRLCAAALMGVWLSLLLAAGGAAEEPAGRALLQIPMSALDALAEPHARRRLERADAAAVRPEPPLPAEATSRHSLEIAGRRLDFTAKAGAALFEDEKGGTVAEIGYFAYTLDGGEPRTRPVTFVINGGPGAASAWLHLGALGPWRIPLTQAAAHPTAPVALVPNADTWLDFTDLVFIDPVGTGYTRLQQKPAEAAPSAGQDDKEGEPRRARKARASRGPAQEKFWSVSGDINSIVLFIKRWVEANGRTDSPKMLVGESYGGFRAPRIAQALQTMPGLALNGIVLISPALADRGVEFPGIGNVLRNVVEFPSLGAALAEAEGPVSPQRLAELERDALGPYLADMLAGPRDKAAVERLAQRIAAVTGLDVDLVRRIGPRSAPRSFLNAIDRKSGRIYSHYDATEKRDAAYEGETLVDGGDDLMGLSVQLARGMGHLSKGLLGWKPEREYYALSRRVHWDWSGQESITALRSALVRDPTFRTLIVHGYADLVTPYLRTKLTLDQMPLIGAGGARVRLEVYGGGHMFYSRDPSRAALRKDALRLLEEVVGQQAQDPPGPTPLR